MLGPAGSEVSLFSCLLAHEVGRNVSHWAKNLSFTRDSQLHLQDQAPFRNRQSSINSVVPRFVVSGTETAIMAHDLHPSPVSEELHQPRSLSPALPERLASSQAALPRQAEDGQLKRDTVPSSAFLQDLLREKKRQSRKTDGRQRQDSMTYAAGSGRDDRVDRDDKRMVQSSPVWSGQEAAQPPQQRRATGTLWQQERGSRGMGARQMEEVHPSWPRFRVLG